MLAKREELALLSAVIDAARAGRGGSVVLTGEAGAGKTTLLRAVLEAADGMTILQATGVPGEGEYGFAGLQMLLRPLTHYLGKLPDGQAEALRGALELPESGDDPHLVGLAVLGLLTVAAEESPVLMLVDDVQWMDVPSVQALLFAVRRLDADRVAAILALRPGEADIRAESLVAHTLETVSLSPLTPAEAVAVLSSLGVATPVALEVQRSTGGNPLALVETGRGLTASQRAGTESLPDTPLMPTAVRDRFHTQVLGLPVATSTALLIAAVSRFDEFEIVAAALDRAGLLVADLAPAEDAGLVELALDTLPAQLRWRHPLVRSAVVGSAEPSARRDAHAAVAGALGAVGEHHGALDASAANHYRTARAWHRAAAALGPDDEVAAALTAVAHEASGRRAYAAAAAAHRRAATLSTARLPRVQAITSAADAAWKAGDAAATAALIGLALADNPPDDVRLRLLRLEALREHTAGHSAAAADLSVKVAALAQRCGSPDLPEILAEAVVTSFIAGDGAAVRLVLQSAVSQPDRGDPLRGLYFDYAEGVARTFLGDQVGGALALHRVLDATRAGAFGDDPARWAFYTQSAAMWLRAFEHERADIYAAIAQLRSRGELAMLPKIVKLRARADANTGRWDAAWLGYTEAVELARITGQTSMHGDALSGLAEISAYRGQEDLCFSYAEQAHDIAAERSLGWNASHRYFEAAALALSVGRFAEAVDLLSGLADGHLAEGRIHLGAVYLPDLVEALIRVGRAEDAASRTITYCRAMATGTNPAEDALACRLRALVAEREKDATDMFEAAIAAHRRTPGTFALARTQLLFGERLRRDGHRRDAREQLRAAAQTFAEYRASPWLERAEAELAATGLLRRPARAAVSDGLTPQELRVALLVADGLTNREAAERLYLSVKTIEFHLGRVYQKLGVRSRIKLAERLRGG